MPYLGVMTKKTYLRLKKTNPKLLLCHGCILPDTLLLGDNKLISEYSVGDHVASQTGDVRVNDVITHVHSGKIIEIKAHGLLPLTVTPEHPVLLTRHDYKNNFDKPFWEIGDDVRIRSIRPDGIPYKSSNRRNYLLVPRLAGNQSPSAISLDDFTNEHGIAVSKAKNIPLTFPINIDTAWLIGLYVAEGSIDGNESPSFSLNDDEIDIQQRALSVAKSLGYSPWLDTKQTSTEVKIGSRLLGRAFTIWCGHGALNKKIPDFILYNNDIRIVEAFLEGYLKGDGYFRLDKNGRAENTASTISKLLALQLQLLLARLGVPAYVNHHKISGDGVILGRKVKLHDLYTIGSSRNGEYTHAKVIDGFIAFPITSISTKDYTGSVYNLETDDSTYLVSNAVVHNCRRELREGDDVIWAAGASRKRYGRKCGDRYNLEYDIPATYAAERAEADKHLPEGVPMGGVQCIVPEQTAYIEGQPEAEPEP